AFINRKHAREIITMNPSFVSSHRYIRYIELAKATQEVDVILYFFTSGDVNFKAKRVNGIYFNHRINIWQEKEFPLPHLLYDRGGGIGKKSLLVINQFRELGIKNINAQHFFDKWDLYYRLSKVEAISPHLPDTVKGNNVINIMQMLDLYTHVYVKTRRGSCGLGVMRIEKETHGKFRYYYSRSGELVSAIITKQEIMKTINHYFAHSPFIIQKPIELMKMGQCITDFRSEVQRNGDGRLIVTGTTARIGRPRSPITSNTRLEDYYSLETFMKDMMQLDALKASLLQTKIIRFLQSVFLAVEHVYGPFGEIGIDFGLDTKGHLWLIECNSKSARVAMYRAFGREKVRQSFSNLLQYAKYLAEKQDKL
ncbi:MAG: YheC/YheD family protein, partial [Firmicutes bacterium]|nr:YheC/YheD family protein [Bacillota bacterium]